MKTRKNYYLLLIIGCLVAGFTLTGCQIAERKAAREFEEANRQQTLNRLDQERQEREREAKKQKELEDNADNAQYQVNHWMEVLKDAEHEYRLAEEGGFVRKSRAQIAQIEKNYKNAKETLAYWIDKRLREIEDEVAERGSEDMPQEYYQLIEIRDELDLDDNSQSDYDEDEEYEGKGDDEYGYSSSDDNY